MAAIIGMEDQVVEEVCQGIDDIVVPANYNSPGQIVISGYKKGLEIAGGRLPVRPALVTELTIQIVKEVEAGAYRAAGAAHPSWDSDSAMCCSALARALSTRRCGASSRSVTMLASKTA